MKVVVQRVSKASVSVEDKLISEIDKGFLILLGISVNDTQKDIEWLVNKIINLRIFSDNDGLMNLSLNNVNGEALIVSQFTLQASIKKGNRPSYNNAAKPQQAKLLYNLFVEHFSAAMEKQIKTGVFGANMQISLINDGPVTIVIDTENKK